MCRSHQVCFQYFLDLCELIQILVCGLRTGPVLQMNTPHGCRQAQGRQQDQDQHYSLLSQFVLYISHTGKAIKDLYHPDYSKEIILYSRKSSDDSAVKEMQTIQLKHLTEGFISFTWKVFPLCTFCF